MDNNIKILFYAPKSPPIGGIATWFTIVYSNCPSETMYDYIDSSVSAKRQNSKKILKKIYSFIDFVKQYHSLRKKLKLGCYDVLHIATSGGNGFRRDIKFINFAKKMSVKTVVHLHFGRTPNLLRGTTKESKLAKKVFRNVDSIITIDDASYFALKQTDFAFKTHLIYNPVIKNPYSYNKESKSLIFVGTLNKNKGIIELVHGFNKLNVDFPEWKLDLFGPNDNENEINALIINNQNSNLCFRGEISHEKLFELMPDYSILILPSYTEGMPYCLLEAMSFGIPCLATDVGNIPSMLRNDKLLFSPKSSVEVEKSMRFMIENESYRLKCSRELYQNVNNNYSIDKINDQLLCVWRSL